ncbi:sodium:calcium antiporter [Ktedonobacteria bacterium brp13]|nr:sodium:calcium antiporter [Ktedonobacteria bacterium brp13]
MFILITGFVLSLLLAIGASAWFTRRLEVLSDLWQWSPGLLSLLGALGANIPNYVASIAAIIAGQMVVGMGIIIGSNIYNIAVILGISTFASPGRRGIVLLHTEAQDVSQVGVLTLAMLFTTAVIVGDRFWQGSLPTGNPPFPVVHIALIGLSLLTLGLFSLLCYHALQRKQHPGHTSQSEREKATSYQATMRWFKVRLLGEMTLALALALGSVILMVQTAQSIAARIALSPAILSLLILAVATSLPNTVVAFTLARTGRASASVEEVLSSNSINVALGIALPFVFWSNTQNDGLLALLDGPLMVVLTGITLLCIFRRHISHMTGILLVLVYVGWVILHILVS